MSDEQGASGDGRVGSVSHRQVRRVAGQVLPVAVAVVLVGVAVVLGLRLRSADAVQSARAAAIAAAEQQAVDVTSVSGADAAAGVARVLAGATGNFRTAYAQQAAALQTTLRDQQVTSTGRVVDSGVVSSRPRTAVVVVVVDATVTNRSQPSPHTHDVRLQLGLERVGSTWLTSSFEILQ